jgi:hypothetical protein
MTTAAALTAWLMEIIDNVVIRSVHKLIFK